MREKKVKETINGINDRNSLVLNLLLSFIFLVIVYFAGNFRNWNSPFATNSDSRFSPKPEKNPTSHYFWQLKPEEVTFWSTASYWICYSLHQLFIWCCIYYSQMKKTKYSTKLHGINIIMIIGNIIFHILHLIQTHIFYDGLAQNVPEASSQSSVIIILSFIIAMESSERGIFLGYPTNPVKKSNMSLIRKYHGYAFAWGAVYTFWYHPTESTWGHLFGFFHTSILMLQGSLIFTEAHLNKYWTIFIEFWVTIHSGIISYQTKNGMWGMFETIGFLIGTWKGEGVGKYPTIETFEYTEELTFVALPKKPILFYTQKTWKKQDKSPLHVETGYIRVPKENKVELVNSQPTGMTEVLEGFVKDQEITLESTGIIRSDSAKKPHVLKSKRIFSLKDGKLEEIVEMATTNTEKIQNHLTAVLSKF
eukprot:gene6834-10999_t